MKQKLSFPTVLVTFLLLAFVGSSEAGEITEIDDPSIVAEAFNAATGQPRLVLLLSPT